MYCPTLITGEVTVGSTAVTLSNMTGVVVNQAVFGTGIPAGTTVKGVDAPMQTVLLSQQATVGGAATPLSFYSYGMPYVDTVGNVTYTCSGAGWLQGGGGGGGGIPYPTGTGIPQVNGGVGWGTSYNAANQIPASYLNLSAYVTSITAAATYQPLLGYTPYNSTNPTGYITSSSLSPYALTSGLGTGAYATIANYPLTSSLGTGAYATIANYLTTASAASTYQPLLGYTPYNSTNPAGYVTASVLASYLQSATAAALYAPIFAVTTNGTSGPATYAANVLNIPQYGSGGIDGVPFCTGFTPVTGQTVVYTTGGTPNPCWSAAGGINLYVNGTLVASGLTGVTVNGY
jgi:hypothetical protein